ncbi:MAG: hypothetical protein WDM87_12735 [Terracidiphilus sp.]
MTRIFARFLNGLVEQCARMLGRHFHLNHVGVDLGHFHGLAD